MSKVKVVMENGGEFVIELYPEYAPVTVKNFEKLVKSGFYDGLTFHRVIDGFMAQGGDPEGTGCGGSDENIKGEFLQNGVNNPLSHTRGVVSMARSSNPDSASSQFFICYDDCSFLDGQYAAFGKVISGMETVDDFLKTERKMSFGGDLRIGYEIYKKALTHGLLLRPLGNVIYFNPPLNIENKDLDKAIALAKQSMDEVLK